MLWELWKQRYTLSHSEPCALWIVIAYPRMSASTSPADRIWIVRSESRSWSVMMCDAARTVCSSSDVGRDRLARTRSISESESSCSSDDLCPQ